ncbi:30S RIBOSOMAL PROTEIN S11 [Mycoplasmopsis pulmonis]|uniref:Small ribosomal subunit protein uS11 n=1 Tax=Mycoplasmopsis pulmonis (strain UAB CTIP) TaxID=272635 RepID=RS11_MYCPU|nr:30S ribosomal protein S11 [Mycoplasmopsis pulmonis]Q98Q07.1 RecName: Full=Small ribosomal subunit protein uS11; AltName: Full=30S ribosomal protein S11 [Mycoplasmopsis pulmonis UAB CTIP]MDZ7293634.1 30S ribosomal protein S11 [Mycoplasmopsis pulmonis]CAC13735.1 30S RIBOSOMAL PROTEIN S11 [Mycoplasmopsis pulmonis]VEU68327.1 30S ribosomal protein S11 [Mycoplasmopsis pulmonis]
MAQRRSSQTTKKVKRKNVTNGVAHIHSTHNNTIVTFSDEKGNVISWASSGTIGYKGTKKKTAYAAGLAAQNASEKAKEHGIREVSVRVKGIGQGRDAARKQIEVSGISVSQIVDVTPQAHNGTRPPKRVLKREKAR